MKLIIAGGRDYHLNPNDFDKLDVLRGQVTEVVCGGATGADYSGRTWATANEIPVMPFPPD
jgi:YspA, cpYpsA-related SLOG family